MTSTTPALPAYLDALHHLGRQHAPHRPGDALAVALRGGLRVTDALRVVTVPEDVAFAAGQLRATRLGVRTALDLLARLCGSEAPTHPGLDDGSRPQQKRTPRGWG